MRLMKFLDLLLGRLRGGGESAVREVARSALPSEFDGPRRTEDIRFSPSGRVLAVVATSGELFLFEVDASARPVGVTRSATVRSGVLLSPHGVDFLDERTVVVANRQGWVTFFRLPAPDAWQAEMALEPVHEMRSNWFGAMGETRKLGSRTIVCGPGSVRVRGAELFIACNKTGSVTVHPFTFRDGMITTGEGTLMARDGELGLADGIAVSRDGRWIAVSDHAQMRVALYDAASRTRCATLRDPELQHPHGLCFDPTGRVIYVADAGARGLHVFKCGAAGWSGMFAASSSRIAAVEAAAFQKTHATVAKEFRALEGGLKGIDVSPDGRLIATTCQNQMLRFFEPVS